MTDNLYAFFRSRFVGNEARPVLRTPDGCRLTYGALDTATARLGNALLKRGLAPGDRVAAHVDKSIEAIVLYLACIRAGLVYVPLNTAYSDAERDRVIVDCAPSLIVEPSTLNELEAEAANLPAELPPTESEIAVLLYTSGTTGVPKGAMMGHAQMAAKAGALVEAWGWRSDDVLLHAMPIFHTHGLFMSLSGALAASAETLLLDRFTIEDVLTHLPEASVFTGVPTMYGRLLAAPGLAAACHNIRLFVCGSAALPPDLFAAFVEATGQRIVECWGMTELPTCASNPLSGERRQGSVGRVMPDTEIRILDSEGRALPNGATGRIAVRTDPPFPGYWGGRKAPFDSEGFFLTGDLGRFSEDGYLSIVGRATDVIISGGYNVHPREVEDALRRIKGIADAAVVGLPHADFGEGVTAVIEGDVIPTEEAIREALKSKLAPFKIPKRVIAVDALPRNATGKVQKPQLRNRFADLYTDGKP